MWIIKIEELNAKELKTFKIKSQKNFQTQREKHLNYETFRVLSMQDKKRNSSWYIIGKIQNILKQRNSIKNCMRKTPSHIWKIESSK